jgi:hypothetical protein
MVSECHHRNSGGQRVKLEFFKPVLNVLNLLIPVELNHDIVFLVSTI